MPAPPPRPTVRYTFANVAPGDYTVIETNPAGYTSTNDTDAPNDDRIGVTLLPSTNSTGNDFLDTADANLATIGNRVWLDENSNGVQDAGEDGIANVTVELRDSSGAPVLDSNGDPITALTDADGGYLFSDLPAGDYNVVVDNTTLPTGLQPIADEDDAADGGRPRPTRRTQARSPCSLATCT